MILQHTLLERLGFGTQNRKVKGEKRFLPLSLIAEFQTQEREYVLAHLLSPREVRVCENVEGSRYIGSP